MEIWGALGHLLLRKGEVQTRASPARTPFAPTADLCSARAQKGASLSRPCLRRRARADAGRSRTRRTRPCPRPLTSNPSRPASTSVAAIWNRPLPSDPPRHHAPHSRMSHPPPTLPRPLPYHHPVSLLFHLHPLSQCPSLAFTPSRQPPSCFLAHGANPFPSRRARESEKTGERESGGSRGEGG